MAASMPRFSPHVAVPAARRSVAHTALACVLSLAVHAGALVLLAYGVTPVERAKPAWLHVELVARAADSRVETPVPATSPPPRSEPVARPRGQASIAAAPRTPPPRAAPPAPRQRLQELPASPPSRDESALAAVEAVSRKSAAAAPLETVAGEESRQSSESAHSRRQVHEWRVQDWLSRFRQYPRAARRAGYEGTVWVRFVLDRRGTLLVSELIESSGHRLLDRAALELLDRAEPFPSLPRDTGLDRIELVLPVDYRLARSDRG